MSLILDALNRSDSDRSNSGDTPGLHSVHGPRGDAPRPTWQRFVWPAVALLFAGAALFMWWGGDAEPEAPAAQTQAAPEPTVAVQEQPDVRPRENNRPVAAPRPERVSSPQQERAATLPRPAPGFSDDVAALYSQMQAAGVDPNQVLAAPPPAPKPAPTSSQLPSRSLADLQQMAMAAEAAREAPEEAPMETAPTPTRSPAYDVDALAQAAQAELANRQPQSGPLVQHEAPFITDLRQALKDQIPSIFYNQHNWSSNPSERSVVLNGEERREGQQIKPGLRLVEILEGSIVLSFNGTEFQLRSLNSWVNL